MKDKKDTSTLDWIEDVDSSCKSCGEKTTKDGPFNDYGYEFYFISCPKCGYNEEEEL